ncbi:ROK family protein [bacterium]|nr:ROK family protein [bacterium]
MSELRIGIDLGGTKIEAAVIDPASQVVARSRAATPRHDYDGIIETIGELVETVTRGLGLDGAPLGICTPGSLSPRSGLLRNSNTVVMNGKPFPTDISKHLGRDVRTANDADCLALSEATDGAAAGAASVFGAILGTGCGGGVVIDGRLLQGANGVAGEWGHNPLPWPRRDDPHESPGHPCWCGQLGCQELYLSGTGLELDYKLHNNAQRKGQDIVAAADDDPLAAACLERYEDRLARALASVINLLDPEVIVLGGGLSNTQRLYTNLPQRLPKYVFSDVLHTRIVQAQHGDASGVRGAAWLWPAATPQ